MGCTRLELICPSTHSIIIDSDGQSYGNPLTGTIYLLSTGVDGPTQLSSLHISLIRTTLLDVNPPSIGKNDLPRFTRRLSLRKPKRESRHGTEKSSFVTEILRCNLSTSPASEEVSPEGNSIWGFEFALSLPNDTPETIKSPSSTVSYELIASATLKVCHKFTNNQSLHLSRLKLPDPWDSLTHFRGFPRTKVRAEFVFRPQLPQRHTTHIHLSALLLLRDISTPGPRHSEISVMVVKRLTWRVDEIEEWNPQQKENGTIRREREIATGCCKGRWSGMKPGNGNPRHEEDIRDMKIAIPFDIAIDGNANALNDIKVPGSSAGFSQIPFLTVQHRLTVDIMTGTETFNGQTLVAQRDSVRGFGATMLVPVHEYAHEPVTMNQSGSEYWMPPYEGMSTSPPDYRGLFDQPV